MPSITHSNIDSADGPISSHTQNSERSVLENCLNQCQLLLLLSELHLEILKFLTFMLFLFLFLTFRTHEKLLLLFFLPLRML